MQITDPIADLLTRIRNASTAKHPSVEIPASNMKKDTPYLRSTEWGRPQMRQRVYARVENLAGRDCFSFIDSLAIVQISSLSCSQRTERPEPSAAPCPPRQSLQW